MKNTPDKKKSNILPIQNGTPGQINKIGPGTVIEGNIKTSSDLRVDGTIIGNIKTKNKVLMGTKSRIEGKIDAKNLGIKGLCKGELKVSDTLHLHGSGKFNGVIFAKNLIIDDGAEFNGECFMEKQAHSAPKTSS
ncbi:MAG: polymer-forming cytoskeletal protein [Bacteroidota bacterium]